MCTDFRQRTWLRSALAALVCLWLVSGPLLAASSLREAESDCCCGSSSACMLGGCDCGGHESRESSPCGGLRSAQDLPGQATVLSFGLHLGLVAWDTAGGRIGSIGQALMADDPVPEPVAHNLELPPPRGASAR